MSKLFFQRFNLLASSLLAFSSSWTLCTVGWHCGNKINFLRRNVAFLHIHELCKAKAFAFLSLIIYTHANICGREMVSISYCFQHESTQIQFIKFNRIFLFVYKEMANNLPRNILKKINKVYALFGILTCIWNKILSFVGS